MNAKNTRKMIVTLLAIAIALFGSACKDSGGNVNDGGCIGVGANFDSCTQLFSE